MIYLNGKFIQASQFNMEFNDRGLLLSDGLFETIRVYKGKVFGLPEHYSRLVSSAQFLNIPVPITFKELNNIITNLLDANQLGYLSQKDSALRITLTRGASPRGLLPPVVPKPTLLITTAELPPIQHTRYKLHVSQVTRRNEYSPLSKMKSLGYLDNILAKMEAEKNDADDAILLNTKGNVASTSVGNLFIVQQDDSILTPCIKEGVLPGVTRKFVIEMCKENSLPLMEDMVSLEELTSAKEIFITNSLIELVSVSQVNGQLIHAGIQGKITSLLQEIYQRKRDC